MAFKKPSNERNWIEGFSKLPNVETAASSFKIQNVRDWRYTEGLEITAKNYKNIEYNFADLETVLFVEEPFSGNKAVAHTFFVFDFKNQEPIGLSIEARREVGENYNMIKGMMREYELYYSWASEKDLLSIRAVGLGNPMYMYPLKFSSEENKIKLLKSVLKTTKDLEANPVFYNTLTHNCTNTLAMHANSIKPGSVPLLHIAWLLPGYADELLYKEKFIPNDKPFNEIQEHYYVTEFIQENIDKEDFSKLLRRKLIENT